MSDPGITPVEVCGRCGHVAGAECPTCGELDPLLGGSIWYDAGGESGAVLRVIRLCHTFTRDGRVSCYTTEVADRAAGTGRWAS